MKRLFSFARKAGSRATQAADQGVEFVKRSIGDLTLFRSAAHFHAGGSAYDEKHYFVIPYRLSGYGYTIYSLRCLPEGAPAVNELPKRRVFHFPDERIVPLVEGLLRSNVRYNAALKSHQDPHALGNRLVGIADTIDTLDRRLTQGMLFAGGLVALAHPLIGAGLMAKGLIPNPGTLLSKLGLRRTGGKLNARRLRKEMLAAEKRVMQQFRGASTVHVENLLLRRLDEVLSSPAPYPEPTSEFSLRTASFGEDDKQRLTALTAKAVSDAYTELLRDPDGQRAADLSPAQAAWIEALARLAKPPA